MPHPLPRHHRLLRALLAACAAATFSWAAARASQAPYDEEFPRKNAWAHITPSVTWCGDASSAVTIEVHIIARDDVTEVEVTNHDEDDRISLYDDGTHGDAASGDRVFTREDVVLACRPASLKYGRAVGTWHGMLRVKLSNGRTAGNNYGFAAGLVNPVYRGTFAAQDFGDGLSATAYAFFIDDSQHEVLTSYPVAPLTCGKTNFEAYRKLYRVLPDAFDLVVLTPGLQLFRPDGFGENVPYQVAVSNAVEHIGLPIMDNSATFGSAGRLTSAVYTSFGTIQIVDHELAHGWGAAIGRRLGLIESIPGGSHWNEMSDVGGQLGAFYFAENGQIGRFTDNGDGTWHLQSNKEVERYSPLELYAMGLIPPEEVPPMHVLTGPDFSSPGRITAASVRTVTIEDVIASEGGIRAPGVAESPKAFDLAFMVVQDGPYNDAAYAYFSLLSYHLMSRSGPEDYDNLAPFYWATGGRATLNTRLPVPVPDPEGLPELGLPKPTPVPTEAGGEPTAPPSSPGPSLTPAMTSASGGEGNPSEPPTTAPPPSTPTPLREGLARCGVLPLGIVVLAAAARSRQPDRVNRRRR
jgi:hypothetical protein